MESQTLAKFEWKKHECRYEDLEKALNHFENIGYEIFEVFNRPFMGLNDAIIILRRPINSEKLTQEHQIQ